MAAQNASSLASVGNSTSSCGQARAGPVRVEWQGAKSQLRSNGDTSRTCLKPAFGHAYRAADDGAVAGVKAGGRPHALHPLLEKLCRLHLAAIPAKKSRQLKNLAT